MTEAATLILAAGFVIVAVVLAVRSCSHDRRIAELEQEMWGE